MRRSPPSHGLADHHGDIDARILTDLIDQAILVFRESGVPLHRFGRREAAAVIIRARDGGYLTERQRTELDRVMNAQPKLSADLADCEQYRIERASAGELVKLRSLLAELTKPASRPTPLFAVARKHHRMDGLGQLAKSLSQVARMLDQVRFKEKVAERHDRNRSAHGL